MDRIKTLYVSDESLSLLNENGGDYTNLKSVKYSLSLNFKDYETGFDKTVNVMIDTNGNTMIFSNTEELLRRFQRNVLEYMETIALDDFDDVDRILEYK